MFLDQVQELRLSQLTGLGLAVAIRLEVQHQPHRMPEDMMAATRAVQAKPKTLGQSASILESDIAGPRKELIVDFPGVLSPPLCMARR